MSSVYVGQYDDAGSKNAFYIIPQRRFGRKRIGFKEFENKNEANFAYRIQSILADKDLAPKVYGQVGRIQKSGYDGELTGYGYLTEIARPMAYCNDEYCDGECFDSDCRNSTIIADIVGMLHFYGLAYSDHHRGNFGYVRRNRQWIPVVIDVGIESFDGWDESIYGEFQSDDEENYGSCNCVCCRQCANPER